MFKYILISGKRCSGKDTLAKIIKTYFDTCGIKSEIKAFADAVKFKYCQIHNLDFTRMMNDYNFKNQYRKEIIQFAQNHKEIDVNVWVKTLLEMTSSDEKVYIICDNRFLHEIEYFQSQFTSNQFLKLRIKTSDEIRKKRGWKYDTLVDEHISEIDLDNYEKFDYVLYNNTTLSDFDKQIVEILNLNF